MTLRSTLLDTGVVTRREAVVATRRAALFATLDSTLSSLGGAFAAAAACRAGGDARGDVSGGVALSSRRLLGRCSVAVVASDDEDDVDGKQ